VLGQQTARRGLGGSLSFRVVALALITLVVIAGGLYAFRSRTQTAAAPTSQATVPVLENGQPIARTVQVGLNDGKNVQVVSGITPG
jgi:hypothetical protein